MCFAYILKNIHTCDLHYPSFLSCKMHYVLTATLLSSVDNKSGEVVPGRKKTMKDFALFSTEQDKPKMSAQLSLAVFQYLSAGN